MATGERRIGSARRGMTVLGKIPTAPKPINLPSQRLENRGLDPNVEIVPRGTLSWGSTDRSPPTSGNAWGNTGVTASGNTSVTSSGNTGVAASPTVSSGPWNTATKVQTGFFSGNSGGGGVENPPRPSSAGNGQRPSSAPVTAGGAWNGAVKSEEQLHASRFTLTPVDFPTLGSDKNPNLRPQQNSVSSARPASADGSALDKERRLLTVPGPPQNVAALQYMTGYGRAGPGPGPGPGPGSGPVPGGYGHPGHGYGNYAQFVPRGVPSQGNHAIPMGPGVYPGPLHHDAYYNSLGAPHYGNIDDREMLMLGMVGNPGVFGHYSPHAGPQEHFGRPQVYGRYPPHPGPPEHFGRPGDGTLGAGPRPPGMNVVFSRERSEVMGYERDGYWGARQDLGKHRDGWVSGNSRDGAHMGMPRTANDNGFSASVAADGTVSDVQKHIPRTILGRHHSIQREWSGSPSGSEPTVSRPVFEEVQGPAGSGPEGPKCLNILLKDKSSQNPSPRTKLLSHDNKGNLMSETSKSIEDLRGSGAGCSDELPNITASSKVIQGNGEIPTAGKERENTAGLDISRERTKSGRVVEQLDSKQSPSGDIQNNSSMIKESDVSLKSGNENEEAVSGPAVNFKEDLCSKRTADISEASITKVPPQNPGASAVSSSTPALSSSLCSGTGSAVKPSASGEKSKMNHASSDVETQKKNEKKLLREATSDRPRSPVVRGEAPKRNDKKVQRDGSQDAQSSNGAAQQANGFKNTTNEDSDPRDEHKPKNRLNHEGEKEWRPKVHVADSKPNVKPVGNSVPPSRKADASVSNADAEVKTGSEKRTPEQDNLQPLDSYDYEGQRAKLRETAAQRARQRQKEEEERSKEQKAKALAKLEELNRRTSVNAGPEEGIVPPELAENLVSSSGSKEGGAAFRKKKQNRNVKSKQRMEGLTIEPTTISEQITLVSDLSSGDISGDGHHVKGSNKRPASSESEGNSPAVQSSPVHVSIYGFTMPDIGKNISFGSFHQDDYAELGLTRSNDDGPTKKIQRKSHSVRRNFRDRPVQDVRPMEKQHATDGMVWAPVRTSASPAMNESESSNQTENNGIKIETDKFEDRKEKNDSLYPQSTTLNKHAEIERHNMKSTSKQQIQQQPAASSQQGQRQSYAREASSQGEKMANVPARGTQHPTESLGSTATKMGIENKMNESPTPGRSHTLWRQRNSNETYIPKDNSRNEMTEKEETNLMPAILVEDPVKVHSDVLKSTSAKSSSQSGHVYKVKFSGGQSTRTTPVLPSKHANHHVDTKKSQLAAQCSDAEVQSNSVAVDTSSKEPSRDIQTRQSNMPGYLSGRSNRAKLFRVQSRQGQSDVEPQIAAENLCTETATFTPAVKQDLAGGHSDREKRSFHEGQFSRRPRSAGANNPRQMATVDDKEQVTASSGSHFNQRLPSLGQSKAFAGATYREKEQHASQSWQMTGSSQKANSFVVKEPNLQNDLGKPLKPTVSVVQQDVKLPLPQEGAASGQAASTSQQQPKASHKQGVDREHLKEGGGSASHLQRKHISGHLQWQQTATSSHQKLTPVLETTGPVHNSKEEISVSKSDESVSGQENVGHTKPLSTKLRVSSENQKPNSDLQPEALPEPGQPFKSHDHQSEVRSEGVANSRQLDFGNGSYTRGRDNWPSRRGRFNGRFRAVNFDRKGEPLSKQRLVFEAAGGAVPSPVMG